MSTPIRIAIAAALLAGCDFPPRHGGLAEPCNSDGTCDYVSLRCAAPRDAQRLATVIELTCASVYCCILRVPDGGAR